MYPLSCPLLSLSLFGPQGQRVELFMLFSHDVLSTLACPWLCFYFTLLFSPFLLNLYSQSPLLLLVAILRCCILAFALIIEEYIVFTYFQFTYMVLAIGLVLFLFLALDLFIVQMSIWLIAAYSCMMFDSIYSPHFICLFPWVMDFQVVSNIFLSKTTQ